MHKDVHDERGAIIELSANGDSEAAKEFAYHLLQMLCGYCDKRGWKYTILLRSVGWHDLDSATLEVSGQDVYGELKREAGVHRAVWSSRFHPARKPAVVSARIVVMPVVSTEEMLLYEEDIEAETYYSCSSARIIPRQHDAIRLWHLPTRVVVALTFLPEIRGMARLRAKADMLLRTKIHHQGLPIASSIVRYYNQASGKVTDPVTGLISALNEVLQGNIQPLVKARTVAEQSAVLRACIEDN